jgi:DNA (cytosine-5)-methyltransferase 1
LFCGAGGFSQGARQAGLNVAFACDSDELALETHSRNHPETKHVQCNLPCHLNFPTDGRAFHLHGSPPCTKFCLANTKNRLPGDKDNAEQLIDWFLETALNSNATSWTMEQVASPHVLKILKQKQIKYKDVFAFHVFDFSLLGVPQTRKRVLAGSKHLISHLVEISLRNCRTSVKDYFRTGTPKGTHIQGSTKWKEAKRVNGKYIYKKGTWMQNARSINKPSFTVTQVRLAWCDVIEGSNGIKGGWRVNLTPKEHATLQTFPIDYKFPEKKTMACKLIANSVPPLVAEQLLSPLKQIATPPR